MSHRISAAGRRNTTRPAPAASECSSAVTSDRASLEGAVEAPPVKDGPNVPQPYGETVTETYRLYRAQELGYESWPLLPPRLAHFLSAAMQDNALTYRQRAVLAAHVARADDTGMVAPSLAPAGDLVRSSAANRALIAAGWLEDGGKYDGIDGINRAVVYLAYPLAGGES